MTLSIKENPNSQVIRMSVAARTTNYWFWKRHLTTHWVNLLPPS